MTQKLRVIVLVSVITLIAVAVALSQQAIPPVPGQGGAAQAGGSTTTPPPVNSILDKYVPVTDARLKQPEPENWLMVRRTYDGWGFSPLDQIKKSNVEDLKLAWVILTGQNNGHEAAPLV